MSSVSFRHVLGSLSNAQVHGYLISMGWSRVNDHNTSQTYTCEVQGENGFCRVSLSTEPTHSHRIDQLYKLVFNVSCIEDREPMEVAQEIQCHVVEEPINALDADSIETILVEQLRLGKDPLTTEATRSFVLDMKPVIARTEFIVSGFSTGDEDPHAIAMQTVLILAPAVQRLHGLVSEGTLRDFVISIGNKLTGCQLADQKLMPNPISIDALIHALQSDMEHAPSESLKILKQLLDEI